MKIGLLTLVAQSSIGVAAVVTALSLAAPSLAGTLTYSGTTVGGPNWNRPIANGSNPPFRLSSAATAVPYSVQGFSVDASGNYNFLSTGTSPTNWDNYTFLYQGSFNRGTPLTNVKIGNDDISGKGGPSGFAYNLTAGNPYYFVTTGFDNSKSGAFSNTISGPGNINPVSPPTLVSIDPVDPSLNLGWNVEGRASAPGDWEVGVKASEAQRPVQKLDWTWQNGQNVPWTLNWNDSNKTITFTFDGQPSISYQSTTTLSPFDRFYLWTRATTEPGMVDPGTGMFLEVNAVNGIPVTPVSSSATSPASGTAITKNYFQSNIPIVSLSGIARMFWNANSLNPQQNSARSRVGFKIEGFDTPAEPAPATTPEPSSILGLMGLAGIGWASRRQKRQTKD